ncbi:MAG TPA: hypothetical protein VHO69_19310, partial [Phototrophicaceae bacterium]|nr:hypothetical protein [Phototrophicaceae bacterium]
MGRYLLIALAGLLPGLATLVLLSGYFQVNITQFLPVGWSDQTYYWHQILTFQKTGFQGGFYTFNEVPPRIESIHYALWGFPYPAIYGLVARVVGWETYTGIFLNMAVMAVCVWACLLLARFNGRQILLTMLALLAVSPVLMFMPTISQETFHQAAALILGWAFLTLLQGKPPQNRFFPGLMLIFFIVIALVRFSWIYLLFPFWLLLGRK